MKKLFAILAVSAIMTACNNESKTEEAAPATDTTVAPAPEAAPVDTTTAAPADTTAAAPAADAKKPA